MPVSDLGSCREKTTPEYGRLWRNGEIGRESYLPEDGMRCGAHATVMNRIRFITNSVMGPRGNQKVLHEYSRGGSMEMQQFADASKRCTMQTADRKSEDNFRSARAHVFCGYL